MSAEDLRPAGVIFFCSFNPFQSSFNDTLFHGHRRRCKGRNARRRQGLLNRRQSLIVVIHDVGTGTAVNMFINKTGDDKTSVGIDEFRAHAGSELLTRDDAPYILFIQNNMSVDNFIRQDNQSVENCFHNKFLLKSYSLFPVYHKPKICGNCGYVKWITCE